MAIFCDHDCTYCFTFIQKDKREKKQREGQKNRDGEIERKNERQREAERERERERERGKETVFVRTLPLLLFPAYKSSSLFQEQSYSECISNRLQDKSYTVSARRRHILYIPP